MSASKHGQFLTQKGYFMKPALPQSYVLLDDNIPEYELSINIAPTPQLQDPTRLLAIIDKRFNELNDPQKLNNSWDSDYKGEGLSLHAFQSSIGQVNLTLFQMYKETCTLIKANIIPDPGPNDLIKLILAKCAKTQTHYQDIMADPNFSEEIQKQAKEYLQGLAEIKGDFNKLLTEKQQKIESIPSNLKTKLVIECVHLNKEMKAILDSKIPQTKQTVEQFQSRYSAILEKAQNVPGLEVQLEALKTAMDKMSSSIQACPADAARPTHSCSAP